MFRYRYHIEATTPSHFMRREHISMTSPSVIHHREGLRRFQIYMYVVKHVETKMIAKVGSSVQLTSFHRRLTTNLNLHQETLSPLSLQNTAHKLFTHAKTSAPYKLALAAATKSLDHISIPLTFPILLQLPSIPRREKVRHRTWIAKPIRRATCKICRGRDPLSSDH